MAESIPAFAKRIGRTAATVRRWIRDGVQLGDRTVKLAAVRVGGRYEVTTAAWDQFQRDLNPAPQPAPESPAAFARRAAGDQKQLRALIGGAS